MPPKTAPKTKYDYDVCIIGGAGHVGLPLGVTFANAGLKTALLDVNEKAIKMINKGIFPFKENGGPKFLKRAIKSKTIRATSLPEVISKSEFIVTVVGTPVDEHLNPDFHIVTKIMENYFRYFRDGQVLILRSTLYPGTSERLQNFFSSRNKKISVSFCPERIAQGNSFEELSGFPQIVSAFDTGTLGRVSKLFSKITAKTISLQKPAEAELSKLLTNAWRYIKFAVGNQFYMIAENHNLNYHEIYKAMVEDYPRNADLPSPGFAAGPCLGKDTMQLAAFNNNNFILGHSAMLINEGLPNFLIKQIKQRLDANHSKSVVEQKDWSIITASTNQTTDEKKNIQHGFINHSIFKEKTVGILGMAFKAESDDARDSLSYKLRKVAQTEAKRVICHDVYINDPSFVNLDKLLKESDIIILGAPHNKYKKIIPSSYPNKLFVDIWNFWQE